MTHKSIKTNRGDVHYYIKGNNATCIVFTHGMTMDYSMFLDQAEYFSKDYTVLLWDVPLHGESRPYRNFTLKNVVADLNQIISSEGFESIHLVGQSMGGYIIQEYALSYPDKVRSMTALDTNPFGLEYYSNFEIFAALKMGKLAWLYPYKTLVKAIAKSSCRTKRARELAEDTLRKMTKKEIIYLMEKVYQELFDREETNHFDMPIQIVYGEFDHAGFVKKYSRLWSDKENYELLEIADAGHNSNVDNPKAFNRILENFVRNVEQ